jgi:hypothetical protein
MLRVGATTEFEIPEHAANERSCLPMCGSCALLIDIFYAVSVLDRRTQTACERSWGWSLASGGELAAHYGQAHP